VCGAGEQQFGRKAAKGCARLDGDAMRELDQVLAQEAGLDTGPWTCARVADLIEERFGVRYHPAHVCRLLHKLGYTGSERS
jgi:transposase